MSAPTLGPLLTPAAFTLMHLRRTLRGYWETEPEARKRNILYPVMIPEGAFPEMLPGFVHITDFGMPAVAQERVDLVPEGLHLVGQVENFLLVEPIDRAQTDERVLRIHPDQEIEYREMPNFVGTQRYGARKPLPNEIGILVKAVTTTYGIGHERGRRYGDVICRVECIDPVAKGRA